MRGRRPLNENRENLWDKRKFAGKKEIGFLLVAAGILCLIIFFFPREKTGDIIATVYHQSTEYTKINLTQARDGTIIKIPGDLPVTLKVKNHRVRFVDSQCPDKTCEHYGYIGTSGEQAICLPAKVGVIIHNTAE